MPQSMHFDQDTDIGGPQNRFPSTHHSAIEAVRSGNKEERQTAFSTILESYWKPAYKYLRVKWQLSNEDAKDLTQSFFATAIEKNYFAAFDLRKARFQTFLRTCLDRFVLNEKKSTARQKRGGGALHLSLDFSQAEAELSLQASDRVSPEELFHREWIRSLFALAVETLRSQYSQNGRDLYFKLFERYDLGESENETSTSYAALANELGLRTTDVTNYLAAARRDFRRIVLDKLRSLTSTEEEFRVEARSLLGIEPK